MVCSADILKGARVAGGALVVLIDARTAAQGAEVVPVVVCAFIYNKVKQSIICL